jgi:hypothetical protein
MSDQQTSIKDRLEEIRSCLPGLQAGTPEPFFVTDVEWLISEVERLRADLARARAENQKLQRVVDEAREYAQGHHYDCRHEYRRCTCNLDELNKAFAALDIAHQQEPGAGQS